MPGIELIVNHKLDEAQLEGVDVVFVNRYLSNTSLNEVEALRAKYGFKFIVDNDDYWELDPHHFMARDYDYFQIPLWIKATLEVADACTTTHERMAEKIYPFNKNVFVLPNSIPNHGQFNLKQSESSFTRLFWQGSITHKRDIDLLRNPIRRFDWPNIQMVMGGYGDHPVIKQIASAYTNGGKMLHNLIKILPVGDYYNMYQECDIALIPLEDTKFNQYKSNLKILEAANVAAPVVVSRVHPYLDFPDDIVNYVTKQSDWYSHVKRLVKDKEFTKEQGQRLREYCTNNFNFETINQGRKQLFHAIAGQQKKTEPVREADTTLAQ